MKVDILFVVPHITLVPQAEAALAFDPAAVRVSVACIRTLDDAHRWAGISFSAIVGLDRIAPEAAEYMRALVRTPMPAAA